MDSGDDGDPVASRVNFAHLDYLLEIVERSDVEYGIVHIYADAPDYEYVDDGDEGAACVDDAARAAVVYLRHYELTGDGSSRRKAEALLRFVMYMQTESGLFYNFVWNNALEINTEHENSRADEFSWWAARSVWALGRCTEVLDGPMAAACAESVRRTVPHLDALLESYGDTAVLNGRTYPQWLIYDTASDATSELLLGLIAMNRAHPGEVADLIDPFAEGVEMMQFGDMATFPYGAHASWTETWHAWGNAQTLALSRARRTESAIHEANNFYPRLLVDGWMHSMDFNGTVRHYEQIAYGVRGVALGLLALQDATDDDRYGVMAGLAASWFTGNNVAGAVMYDSATGRGYDGISGPDQVNRNSGAESTIEALYTILEIEQHPAALEWLDARGGAVVEVDRDEENYRYRVFTSGDRTIALVLNEADREFSLLDGQALAAFLDE